MTPPVFGLRPMRAARFRASKFPKPVICTFAPFFNSPAMIPLSSNRASIVRPASALDIFVRMARAAVSSALFMAHSWVEVVEKALQNRPCTGGASQKPLKNRYNMGYPLEKPQDTSTSLTSVSKTTTLSGVRDQGSVFPFPRRTPDPFFVPRHPPRLDRSHRRGHVFRQVRRAHPAGSPRRDRP